MAYSLHEGEVLSLLLSTGPAADTATALVGSLLAQAIGAAVSWNHAKAAVSMRYMRACIIKLLMANAPTRVGNMPFPSKFAAAVPISLTGGLSYMVSCMFIIAPTRSAGLQTLVAVAPSAQPCSAYNVILTDQGIQMHFGSIPSSCFVGPPMHFTNQVLNLTSKHVCHP